FGDRYFLIGPDVWRGKNNKEFVEDKELYAPWRKFAEGQGLNFRIGHWAIEGNPIVILVDFMSQIVHKDDILADFWEDYKLDSISGQWDYIEPVLFGYTAAKIVESFYTYQVYPQEKVYAHFHEWMTGSGVLYLKKKMPQIATIFTTHATVIGRCIAGNSLPLYSELSSYNAEELSIRFGVKAKFSMEKLASIHADAFTTVSEITNNECRQFFEKPVDVITENGFDDAFVPKPEKFEQARSIAKQTLIRVTQALLNQKVEANALFVINSGRYEFRNKGIDLFLDSLAAANKDPKLDKQIIAYLTIPADSAGARHDLIQRMQAPDYDHPIQNDFSTHYLNNADQDPIIQRLRLLGLHNAPEDKVKVVFVPCYLDGKDGIFNCSYYDLLIGFDASVFPSYYEPWGYTPLESIAFGIPTLSTTLAGFGQWVQSAYPNKQMGVYIAERTDLNDADVVAEIACFLIKLTMADPATMQSYRDNAYTISRIALWDNLIDKYSQAYEFAEKKWEVDKSLLNKVMPRMASQYTPIVNTQPEWKKIIIKPNVPNKLIKLDELSKNLWWSWNYEAENLFQSIDPILWEKVQQNPMDLLTKLNTTQIKKLENDAIFHQHLDAVYAQFRAYMDEPKKTPQPQIAYFSMEFGLHQSLKIYSGGLGILAGDYLKAASDKNVDMIGIGLLYRYGYFHQQIANTGEQIAESIPQQFSKLPLEAVRNDNGEWLIITLSFPGRKIYAKVWKVAVGRIPLYLLDTDIEQNSEVDRTITHHLYGGDWENRFKQELLLGIGGIRILRKLKLYPQVYHCNEGHAAFIGVERLREYVEKENKIYLQAKELVRFSSLFTTHTPVPAGHDEFSEDLVRTYLSHYPQRLNITWDTFMALGRSNASDIQSKFSMSCLAANLSQEINGVSRIHGRVSREIFANMYPGYYPEELQNIGYVTNGVHYKTWTHEKWQN
ncbi:MAG: alpha-glucan family phosphorylase, partial [Bacteroidales bacterium]